MTTAIREGWRSLWSVVFLLAAAAPLLAQEYYEEGDASDSVIQPTMMPKDWILSIFAGHESEVDADVFQIDIVDPNDFYATTDGTEGDTQIWLFTSTGRLIDFNDNMGRTNYSAYVNGRNVPEPGIYSLAITRFCFEPVNSRNSPLWLDENTYSTANWAHWVPYVEGSGYCWSRAGTSTEADPPLPGGSSLAYPYKVTLGGVLGTQPAAAIWPADSLALVDLFWSTDGPAWYQRAYWLDGPVRIWYGIETVVVDIPGAAPVRRVRNVNLPDNNLAGELPVSILDLTYVRQLNLAGNSIRGQIPADIGKMAELSDLNLSTNLLSGGVPSSLGRLVGIQRIQLQNNRLSGGIPSQLGEALALLTLDLGNNGLGGSIPTTLLALGKLQNLHVGANRLEGPLPSEIGRMGGLETLEFYQNEINGPLPASLTELGSLWRLFFFETKVCMPPERTFQAWLEGLEVVEGNGNFCEPVIGASPSPLDFGSVEVGATKDLTLTVSNTGLAPASVTVSGYLVGEEFQVISGSGTTTMAPGTSRYVGVRFSPTSPGSKTSSSLAVSYTGERVAGGFTVTANGLANAPSIAVNQQSLAFGDVPLGGTKDLTLTITNTGTATLTGSVAGGAGFADNGFTFVSGSGAFSLSAQQSKSVVVRFSPSSAGSKSSSVSITHNAANADSPYFVPVSGNGVAPTISVSPQALAFGDVLVGATRDLTVTITNTGLATMTGSVAGDTGFAENGFSFVSGSGAFTLSAQQSKNVVVRLSPPSMGAKSSAVRITHNASNADSPFSVPLTGNGIAPIIAVSPEALSFGDVLVGSTRDLTLTISNTGTATMTGSVAGGTGFADNGFSFVSGSGAFTLAVRQSKEVIVRLSPPSVGPKSSSVSITHNGSNTGSPLVVGIAGSGIAPSIAVNPQSLGFGDVPVGTTKDLSVTITNTGTATLTGSVAGGTGFADNGFSFVSGSGAFSLTAQQSKSVTVRLTPPSAGAKSSSLSITHNASNADSPLAVSLTGNGTAPSISVKPASLTFGDVQVGTTKDLTISITNTGNSPLSGSVAAGANFETNGFTFESGSGSYTLNAGEAKNVVVRLAPPSVGAKTSSVSITHNASNTPSPVTVSLTGNGTAAPAPSFSLSPTSLSFGDVQVGTTKDLSVTITNTGNATMTGAVSEGANFAANGFSIVSGGGAYTLGGGQVRSVVVRLAPPSTGSKSSALTISHNASNEPTPISVPLTGNGTPVPAPLFSLNPAGLSFGDVQVGLTKDLTLVIANTGNAAMTGSVTAAADFAANGFLILGGAGNYTLQGGESKEVVVRLAPPSVGSKSSSLRVTHDAANAASPATVVATGNGTPAPAPTISVSPGSLTFGDVQIGTTKDLTVAIANTGNAPLSGVVSAGSGSEANGYSIQSGTGSFVLSGGESKDVLVRFGPLSEGGKVGSLSISHDAANVGSPIEVGMVGNGTEAPAPSISVYPTALVFGEVQIGVARDLTLIVSNTGNAPLEGSVSAGADFEVNGFSILSGAGEYSLNGGENQAVVVRLVPPSEGVRASSVSITHNATNEATPLSIAVEGNGTSAPAPAIDVNPAGLAFADVQVGTTMDLTVTIKNLGNAPLTGETLGASDFGDQGFAVVEGGGAFNLEPEAVHLLTIRFAPQTSGDASSSLEIAHNDERRDSPVIVPVSGNGFVSNVGPVAVPDTVTAQPGSAVSIAVLANDSDPNGDSVELLGIVVLPLKGVAVPQSNGTILYTPFETFTEGSDTFQYQISDGTFSATGTVVVEMASGVAANREGLPHGFRLEQNYPNPFNPTTRIRYTLEASGHVLLRLCDLMGRSVQTLVDQFQSPGTFEALVRADNLAGGSYAYVLELGGFRQVKVLTLLK